MMRHTGAFLRLLVATICLVAAAAPLYGQVPYLVKDIATGLQLDIGSDPTEIVEMDGYLYFAASTPIAGVELWRSDGTAAGAELVRDMYPGTASSNPRSLTVAGGKLFFLADTEWSYSAAELWVSDGTDAGTQIVLSSFFSDPQELTEVAGRLVFIGYGNAISQQAMGKELWYSDGTTLGTRVLRDLYPGSTGSDPMQLANIGGVVYFSANDGSNGRELWRTDGTYSGTLRVSNVSGSLSPQAICGVPGQLFFRGYSSTEGYELWKSDGTEAGTMLVSDIRLGTSASFPNELMMVGSTLYFTADDGSVGRELWKSDGSGAGTVLVSNIDGGTGSSSPTQLTAYNGGVVFTADDGSTGRELWASDGSVGGTALVRDIDGAATGSAPSELVVYNGVLVFSADDGSNGRELWQSDGTLAGTTMLKDIAAGAASSSPLGPVELAGNLYFAANDGTYGNELWTSDGTGAGTVLLTDIAIGESGSNPYELVVMNGILYFTASDATYGNELWRSDGTEAGTYLVDDIVPGSGSSSVFCLTVVGNELYFGADDGSGVQLWKSDGSSVSFVSTINPGGDAYPCSFTQAGGELFFSAQDTSYGRELWKTDGTGPGTVRVSDINSGYRDANPNYLVDLGGELLFSAIDNTWGESELWKSDGTAGGTVKVKAINPSYGSVPYDLTVWNGSLFFSSDDGSNGRELWISDGTSAGTVLLSDICPGSCSSSASAFFPTDDHLYFNARHPDTGAELWRSDGTGSGTELFWDLNYSWDDSSPYPIVDFDAGLLLSYSEYSGETVLGWVGFDGISRSVSGLKDVYSEVAKVTGSVYISAHDGFQAYELWRWDSADETPVLAGEIVAGTAGPSPDELTPNGNLLFFTADDGVHGRELWAMCAGVFYQDADGDGLGDPAISTVACAAPAGYVENADDCDDSSVYSCSCACGTAVAQGAWALISPGCATGTSTVEEVFGDDLDPAAYGSTWMVIERDEESNTYHNLALADTLVQGEGYWIKSTDVAPTLDVDGGPAPTLCPESSMYDQCFDTPLVGGTGDHPNLKGFPFSPAVAWADARFVDGAGTEYSPAAAELAGLASKIMYRWNGNAYASYDGETPGAEGTLEELSGFWVKAHQDLTLRIPTAAAAAGKSSRPAAQTGKALDPAEWYLRLSVSGDGMTDEANLLGRLSDSVDGRDTHDLDEMAPFGDRSLTVVFPHPEWGTTAWSYTSDYREARPGAGGRWELEIRADSARQVTLSWEGAGSQLADILSRSRLVDEEHQLDFSPGSMGSLTIDMVGSTHRLSWSINALPLVDAGPDREVAVEEILVMTVAFSDEDQQDTHMATIDWGDGVVTGAVVDDEAGTLSGPHAYQAAGLQTAEICVVDEYGGEGCAQVLVQVGAAATQIFSDGFESGDLSRWSSQQ